MYVPALFAVTDPTEMDQVLADLRLGCLVTKDEGGFFGSHIPMLFDPARHVLTGHISKANTHPARCGDGEALAIFQGPNAYVSPNWYPSKAEHGKAVPTWNYEAVHIEGTVSWHTDSLWLQDHLRNLTDHFESGQATPWMLSDAPADYVDKLLDVIVGLELHVRTIQIKWKLSQNRTEADREGALAGLLNSDDPAAQQVARLMTSMNSVGAQ